MSVATTNERFGWTEETSPISKGIRWLAESKRNGTLPAPPKRAIARKLPPLARRSLPCIHEGAILEFCTCNDDAKHVHDCDKHERCTRGPSKIRSCSRCPDFDDGTGAPLAFHIHAGIGDAVSVLYAACGLADATGRRVDLHTNHPAWLAGVSHPGVRIRSGKSGPDVHRRYNDQLVLAGRKAVASRSQWYADQLAAQFGVETFAPKLPQSIEKPDRVIDGDYVVLSPFSAHAPREWGMEKWRELASALVADGLSVVVIGTRSDLPRMKAAFAGIAVDLKPGQSVAWVLSLLAHAHQVVGNDSGMAHLAAMHGTSTYVVMSHLAPGFVFSPAQVRGITPDPATWPCAACAWRRGRGYSAEKCGKGCLALQSIGMERVRETLFEVTSERVQ